MTTATAPLLVAVNRLHVCKMQDDPSLSERENLAAWRRFNTTFENESLDVDGLLAAVAAGHSFCPRHRHVSHKQESGGRTHYTSYRHSLNWMPTSVFGIDIDHGGMTLAQLEMDDFFHRYGCLGYTTPSHTEAHPRVRAVFALESPVEQIDNYRFLKRSVAARYGADPCDANPMHAYAGNATPSFFSVHAPSNRLPISVARAEVLEFRQQREREAAERAARASRAASYGDDDWPNADDVAEMLRHMPKRSDYMKWVKTLMAVYSEFPDETGIALIEGWAPGKEGEVAAKFRSFRQSDDTLSIGWLITAAKGNGYTPRPARERRRSHIFTSFMQRR